MKFLSYFILLTFSVSSQAQILDFENQKSIQKIADLESKLYTANRLIENYIDGELDKGSFLEIYNQNEVLKNQANDSKNQNDNLLLQLEEINSELIKTIKNNKKLKSDILDLNSKITVFEANYQLNLQILNEEIQAQKNISLNYASKIKQKNKKIDLLESYENSMKRDIIDLNSEISQNKADYLLVQQTFLKEKLTQKNISSDLKNKNDSLVNLNKDLYKSIISLKKELLNQETISNQFAKAFSDLMEKNNKIIKLFKIFNTDIFKSKEKFTIYLGEFDAPLNFQYLEDLSCIKNLNNKFFCFSGKFNNEENTVNYFNKTLEYGYQSQIIKF